ncbi:uncharacterized protein [Rutidosis leptorrhynchoides]|uniref:uncharacterized protein n=1 Tax=Rutidosis leptorrhynchoides TaxID=125765 RepID=UPI003A9A626E
MVREAHKDRVEEEIANGKVETGTGKNQELSLVRAGETRWGSHHNAMFSLKSLFPEVVKVLEYVKKDGDNALSRRQASGVTNVLSQALQKKDQNILEAVSLVQATKMTLQNFRANGFDELLKDVNSFCQNHGLEMLSMDEDGKTRVITVLDMIIQEFGDRFSEVSTELLTNMAALSPRNSFFMFDASKLMKLSKMYPLDFNKAKRDHLKHELDIYYEVLHQDEKFSNLKGIADLARLMVETEKDHSFRYVYRLLKLALVLPVATATVER